MIFDITVHLNDKPGNNTGGEKIELIQEFKGILFVKGFHKARFPDCQQVRDQEGIVINGIAQFKGFHQRNDVMLFQGDVFGIFE